MYTVEKMKVQEPVLKQELPRRKDLPGDNRVLESPGEIRREPILLIHGTFANKAVGAPAWWQPGHDFCQKLNSCLSQQGSPARCWAHIGNGKNVFAWTGDNLETERRIGGDNLAKAITDLEASLDISRYHIVAHSHGGNVVLNALRSLAVDPKNLGAVIFLGTPVLCFSRWAPWLNRSEVAHLFYFWGAIFGTIAGMLLTGWLRFVTLPIVIAFGLLLNHEYWTRPRRKLPIYGAGHAHAFEFADDEAMKALRIAVEFARRPRDVLKQLFGTEAPPEYSVDPQRPRFWAAFWSDFKRTGPYRLLKAMLDPPWRSLWQSLRQSLMSVQKSVRLKKVVKTIVFAFDVIMESPMWFKTFILLLICLMVFMFKYSGKIMLHFVNAPLETA